VDHLISWPVIPTSNSTEEALRLKEAGKADEVVVSVGPAKAEETLLLDPFMQRRRQAADLGSNRRHRRPSERMFGFLDKHHEDSPLTQYG
jgi:hypothetical protein